MIAGLLAALAVIGKLLLILLVVVLIILALILFFPVSYRADIRKHPEELRVKASVSWLFRFLYVTFSLDHEGENKNSAFDVRVAGISIPRLLEKRKQKKAAKEAAARKTKEQPTRVPRKEAPKKPTVQPGQRLADQPVNLKVEVIEARHPGFMERLGAHISAFIGKIKTFFRKLAGIVGRLSEWMDYLGSESFGRAKDKLFHEGGAIVRHILPKKAEGYVRFGMNDPAQTGMICGIVCMFLSDLPDTLSIDPDFMDPGVECDVTLKGRIFLIVLAVRAVRILLCKDVRILIGKILHKDGKKKDAEKKNKNHKGHSSGNTNEVATQA